MKKILAGLVIAVVMSLSSFAAGGEYEISLIAKLSGIRCGDKPTSCPDQLARALMQMKRA